MNTLIEKTGKEQVFELETSKHFSKTGSRAAKVDISNPVTITEALLDKKIDDLKKTIEFIGKPIWAIFVTIIVGVIIALFLGMIGILVAMQAMVLESNNLKNSSYKENSEKIDILFQRLDSINK